MLRVLSCSLLFAACAAEDDVSTPSLEVSWTVGADGCASAGVEEVAVTFDGAQLATAPCDDGGLVLAAVQPGHGLLALFGRDADGVNRYASEPVVLTIADDDVVVEPQRLTAMTARIEVSWYFSNGRLCSANEVQQVRVDVWDDGFLIAEPVSPCDDGYLDVRSLPSGDYHLELSGLEGPSQNPTFGGALDVSLEKGDVRQIDVSLDPL